MAPGNPVDVVEFDCNLLPFIAEYGSILNPAGMVGATLPQAGRSFLVKQVMSIVKDVRGRFHDNRLLYGKARRSLYSVAKRGRVRRGPIAVW